MMAEPAAAAVVAGFTYLTGGSERPTPVPTLAQGR